MKKRLLGKTGIAVSEIAFGGVEIGIPYGIGVHNKEDMLPRANAIALLREALDKGMNFFDTARLYGESETIMGEAFHDRRDKVVIATKCKHFKDEQGNIPRGSVLRSIIEESLHESLAQLQTDYVDVFMLHQADMGILQNDDVLKIFTDLKSAGKIRATGASTYTTIETRQAIKNGWDVIQMPFNLMDQSQSENFKLAEDLGTALVVRSVLMKGLLSNKGRNLHPALAEVERHISGYQNLLTPEINNISTLAVKFALSFSQVAAVLVGIDKPEYLADALKSVEGEMLNGSQLQSARDLAYPDVEFLNLPYWDKMGWLT